MTALKNDIKDTCYRAFKDDREIVIPQFIDGCVGKYINTNTNTSPNDAFWIEEAFENAMTELLQEGLYVMSVYHIPENRPRFFIDLCYKVVDLDSVLESGNHRIEAPTAEAFRNLEYILERKSRIAKELEEEQAAKEAAEAAENSDDGEPDADTSNDQSL
jgi:hypothetical protein